MLAASNAPWWGVPIIAGVFALLGAYVASSLAAKQAKRQAEEQRSGRWLQDLRQACAKYVEIVDTYVDTLGTEASHDDDIGRGALAELELIAPADVVAVARDLQRKLLSVALAFAIAKGSREEKMEDPRFEAYAQNLADVRSELLTVTRAHLDINPPRSST